MAPRPRLVQTRSQGPASEPLAETPPTGHGRARGLVSNRSSGRRVEARTFAPPAELADLVAAYWVGRWDLHGQPPHRTQLLSDPCVHFVVETGGTHAGARLVGVWTRLWKRTLAGRGCVRGVKLRAGALRGFVDQSAHLFTNRIVSLADVFPSAQDIETAVTGLDDDGEALARLSDWLNVERGITDHDVALAVNLVEHIAADPEITSAERLATVSGLGVRALQRLFRGHVGASPKWVIRRNRLQEVALRIERGGGPSLAALAADLGYTDQAHLTRDFKAAVGKTPGEFAGSVHE